MELNPALGTASRHLPLAAVVAAVLSVLWGRLGQKIGLPLFFWRPPGATGSRSRRSRIAIGASTGGFLGGVVFVGLLVESGHRPEWVAGDLRGLLTTGLIAAGAALLIVWLAGPYRRPPPIAIEGCVTPAPSFSLGAAAWFPLGALVGLLGFGVLVAWLPGALPRAWWQALGAAVDALPDAAGRHRLPDLHETAAVLFALAALLYLALLALERFGGRHVYPAAAFGVLSTALVAAYGFVAFHLPQMQVWLVLLAIAAWAAASAVAQRPRVVGLEGLPPGVTAKLVCDEQALQAWLARQRRGPGEAPGLVVVCADGGGIRSALWAGIVLTTLEERLGREFASRVRLLTGASGGMLGAAYWAATLAPNGDGLKHARTSGETLAAEDLLDGLQRGGLSAAAAALVFRDLLIPPFRVGPDRGRALELAWERNTRGELARPLSTLAAGEREGWRPSVVLTPMIADDGRRLVVSNLDLGHLLAHAGPVLNPDLAGEPYALGGVALFERLGAAHAVMPLSTAIRLQANFPWVMPATELPPFAPGGRRCRVVDAGYFDDCGVDLATAWLRHHAERLAAEVGSILVLQIRDRPSAPRREPPSRPRSLRARALDGWLTPVSAARRAREATTWFRNDEKLSALAERFAAAASPPRFTTCVFELPVEASLSWSLTADETTRIRSGMECRTNLEALAALEAWWSLGSDTARVP